jgi:uncharacterized membrane protein (DUF485 family)
MNNNILRRVFKVFIMGVVMGCTIFVLIGVFWEIISKTQMPFEGDYGFVKQALCCVGVSLGFTMPSLVYRAKKIAFPLQIVIHMASGFALFGVIAYFAKWIPVEEGAGAVAVFVAVAVVSSLLIWLGFYFYGKREAARMNKVLAERQREEESQK